MGAFRFGRRFGRRGEILDFLFGGFCAFFLGLLFRDLLVQFDGISIALWPRCLLGYKLRMKIDRVFDEFSFNAPKRVSFMS